MSPNQIDEEDTGFLIDIGFGYVKTECLRASYNLGVYDSLAKNGPQTSEAMAKSLSISDDHLDKLLTFVVLLGLLDKEEGQDGKDVYKLNDVSRKHFVRDSTERTAVFLGNWLDHMEQYLGPPGHISQAIREGRKDPDEDEDPVPVMKNMFDKAIQGTAMQTFMEGGFDFSGFKSMCDLTGGSTGSFAKMFATFYPDKEVTVCGAPPMMEKAKALPENKDTKVKFVSCVPTSGELPKSDLYVLNLILSRLNNSKVTNLIKDIRKNINPGGGILVIDSVYDNDKLGPTKVNLIEMSQVPRTHRFHRTRAEYNALFAPHDFKPVHGHRYRGFGFRDAFLMKLQ